MPGFWLISLKSARIIKIMTNMSDTGANIHEYGLYGCLHPLLPVLMYVSPTDNEESKTPSFAPVDTIEIAPYRDPTAVKGVILMRFGKHLSRLLSCLACFPPYHAGLGYFLGSVISGRIQPINESICTGVILVHTFHLSELLIAVFRGF